MIALDTHSNTTHVCLPVRFPTLCHTLACSAQFSSFNVAASRELQHVYAAKGEPQLSANLARHIRAVEAREALKKAGKAHGSATWTQLFGGLAEPEQWEVVEAAHQRKRELGLIRPRRRQQQDSWQAAQHDREQQQQQHHSRQQQQQQRNGKQPQPPAASKEATDALLAGFDFSAAVQTVQVDAEAAQRQSKAGRRRRVQQQQQ